MQRAAELLNAEVTIARGWADRMNPLSGVATFVDGAENERRLDFLERVHGLDSDDVRATALSLEIDSDGTVINLWVMHPERCMESRVRNAELPNKQTELAYRQLDASIVCARAFNELLLDDAGAEGAVAVRKLSERIFALAHEPIALTLYRERGVDITAAVVEDDRLPDLYLTRRLPQLRQKLARKRQ